MKKLITATAALIIAFTSCKNNGNGELIGVQNRPEWYQPDPYGMLFIPLGSFDMGNGDQDVPSAYTTQSKTVTVESYYMDQTEITNNEYRQFVQWVTDSIARKTLGEGGNEKFLITQNEYGEDYDPPFLNWDEKIDWGLTENRENLAGMFLPENERFYRKKEIDSRKLNYEYYWIDLQKAAKRVNRWNKKTNAYDDANREQDANGTGLVKDRSSFITKDVINVFPDTLAWIHDFSYAFNDPTAQKYFWHPAFDEYPVVGVSWKQARAFCIWRTNLLNSYLAMNGTAEVQDFRLPSEVEWEYASRGGYANNPYPWGGPYTKNAKGCFLGNFKPGRGTYQTDGGAKTVKVAYYSPNNYGLYDMGGNVAEWTSNAFDESGVNFTHDFNPNFIYEAKEEEPSVLKRKVIRGGSWKDIAYYMNCGTRTYEYQDTAKCYIGFRCVMSYLGRSVGDGPNNLGN